MATKAKQKYRHIHISRSLTRRKAWTEIHAKTGLYAWQIKGFSYNPCLGVATLTMNP